MTEGIDAPAARVTEDLAIGDQILESLPRVHATLLMLEAAGASENEIADHLGIPVESVGSVSEIARRKLRRLLDGA